MCIIFNSDVYKASDTLIVVSPVATPSCQPQQWQLVYLNSLNQFSIFGSKSPLAPLMVVPLPNPHNLSELDFPLYSISNDNARTIRRAVDEIIKPYGEVESPDLFANTFGTPSTSLFGSQQSQTQPPPLKLQTVGGYKVCVAPSLSDLKSRAPWDRFSIDSNEVKHTLTDLDKRYGHEPMAFVIAEGYSNSQQHVNVGGRSNLLFTPNTFTPANNDNNNNNMPYLQNAGFAISYRDARTHPSFFPTSHEPSRYSQQSSSFVQMDVTLVAINAIIRPLSIIPVSQHTGLKPHNFVRTANSVMNGQTNVILRLDDSFGFAKSKAKWSSHMVDLFHSLPRMSISKNTSTMAQLETPRLVTFWRLNGQFPNTDVTARAITDTDVHVTNRLFNDVDAWIQKNHEMNQTKNKNNSNNNNNNNITINDNSAVRNPTNFPSAGTTNPTNVFRSNESPFKSPSPLTSTPSPTSTTNTFTFGWTEERFGNTVAPSLLQRLDIALALLARQLADPGICDRYSDAMRRGQNHMEQRPCGPVTYFNLDIDNTDLDEDAYLAKEQWARIIRTDAVDTTGTTYVRISATPVPFETLQQRTVQPLPNVNSNSDASDQKNQATPKPSIFIGARQ